MLWKSRPLRAAIAAIAAFASSGCYVGVGFDGTIVGTALDIRQPPQSQTVHVGERASFAVGVEGATPVSYQWRRNGADIAGAIDITYITPPVTLADDGALFTVRVCNPVVCLTSSPALLSVLPK